MKATRPTREQLTDQEWERLSEIFATMRRLKAKLKAKGGAA